MVLLLICSTTGPVDSYTKLHGWMDRRKEGLMEGGRDGWMVRGKEGWMMEGGTD